MDQNLNLLYLYDLPKDQTSSTKIALVLKEVANITDLEAKPQILKDFSRPFYTAIVSIRDPEQF